MDRRHPGYDRRTFLKLAGMTAAITACSDAATRPAASGPTSDIPKPTPSPNEFEELATAKIEIDSPEAAMVGHGSVWVITHRGSAMFRIDPVTLAKTEIALDAPRTFNQIIIGPESVWIMRWDRSGDRQYLRIAVRTNKVAGVIPVGGNAALGGGFLWLYDLGDLTQVDPETDRIVQSVPRLTPLDNESSIAYAQDALWIGTQRSGVFRVDPRTLQITARIDVVAWKVVSDGVEVWAIDEGAGRISRIDVARNVAEPAVDTRYASLARVVPGSVLVADTGHFAVVDRTTSKLVRTFSVPRGFGAYADIGFGSLWTPMFGLHQVWRAAWPLRP